MALVALGGLALTNGTAFTDSTDLPDSESATAYSLIGQGSDPTATPTESGKIVWHSDGAPVAGRQTRTEIAAPIEDAIEAARSEGLQIEAGGQAFTEQPAAGGATEMIGLIVALVLLLLVFRSFNRHRKALLAGADVPSAVAQALNTSGRAVIFAGLTVTAAPLGMVVIGLGLLTGMAFSAVSPPPAPKSPASSRSGRLPSRSAPFWLLWAH